MDREEVNRGVDPNTATRTKDAIDPETGALGTAGTPVTTGEGLSGSTIGTGSQAGEAEQESGDFGRQTPNADKYVSGQTGE
jgi:hypothetical protein